jgi:integrase/recombinase XerC
LYAHSLTQLAAYCEAQQLPLLLVERSHIRQWLAKRHSMGIAPSTLATELTAWRGFYRWLALQGHILHNPCQDVRAPRSAKALPKALGADAAMALASYRPPTSTPKSTTRQDLEQAKDTLIVELLYGCGLRVSELVGLDLHSSAQGLETGQGWIDAQAAEVHVLGKGSKRRMVPLGRKAAEALADYLALRLSQSPPSQNALLINAKGERLSRQAVWQRVKQRSLAAGLANPVHPHMLRHSFASHVLQSSSDLRAVQELLGHSSIASTQVYTKLDFQHLAKIYDNTHPRAKLK